MTPTFLLLTAISVIPPFADYHREWDGPAQGLYWKDCVLSAIPIRSSKGGSSILEDAVYRSGPISRLGFNKFDTEPFVCVHPGIFENRHCRLVISGNNAIIGRGFDYLSFTTADLPCLEPSEFGLEMFNLKYNPSRGPTNQHGPFRCHSYLHFFPEHREGDFPDKKLFGNRSPISVDLALSF